MPSLDLLATFLEIYRAGSLSAAAQRLGVTQPAVTGQLARLEEQIGEPLFVRSRKGVTPTPRAAALAARVSLHLDGLRDALGSTEAESALRGTVRIGGAAEAMTLRVLPALAPLTGRGLALHATFGLAQDLLTELAADRLDLVVSAIRPTHQVLLAVPLVGEEFRRASTTIGPVDTVNRSRHPDEPVGTALIRCGRVCGLPARAPGGMKRTRWPDRLLHNCSLS